jgi:hypothetical protein
MMLDGWSTEDLLIPFQPTEQFALSSTQAHYSMGPGGDWDTVRPERVEIVRLLRADGSTVPVMPSTPFVRQWQDVIPNGDPSHYIAQADSVYARVEFNAYPLAPNVLVTTTKPFNATALDNFDESFDEDADDEPIYASGFTLTGIQTAIDFPPGYEQCIVANLAVVLSPEYPGIDLPAVVVAMATRTKANIKRRNLKAAQMVLDRTLHGGRQPYNVNAG